MPVYSRRIEGGARVILFYCETCGAPASFGRGVGIRAALRARSPAEAKRLAGQWYCGWRDGNPACIGKGEDEPRQHDLFAAGG